MRAGDGRGWGCPWRRDDSSKSRNSLRQWPFSGPPPARCLPRWPIGDKGHVTCQGPWRACLHFKNPWVDISISTFWLGKHLGEKRFSHQHSHDVDAKSECGMDHRAICFICYYFHHAGLLSSLPQHFPPRREAQAAAQRFTYPRSRYRNRSQPPLARIASLEILSQSPSLLSRSPSASSF